MVYAQYRIGSLEIALIVFLSSLLAQYRIGSLEIIGVDGFWQTEAQYRIGSLETKKINTVMRIA